MMGSLNTSNAVVAFDKMEEKVCVCAWWGLRARGCRCAETQGGDKEAGMPARQLAGPVDGVMPLADWPSYCCPRLLPPTALAAQVMAMEAESEAVTMLVAGDGLETKFAQVSVSECCFELWGLCARWGGGAGCRCSHTHTN
jgi:hypothetical protein